MVRVLFLNAVGEKGGAEVVLFNLARRLDRGSFSPRVVCMRHGPFVDELRSAGIPTSVIEISRLRHPLQYVRAVAQIGWTIRRHRVDIIVSNGGKPHFYAAPAAALMRIPEVWYVHDPPESLTAFDRLLTAIPCHQLIAVSPKTIALARSGRLHAAHHALVTNGIDAEAFRRLAEASGPLDRSSLRNVSRT